MPVWYSIVTEREKPTRRKEVRIMKISKNFVQKYVSHDCEARDHEWEDTDKTYEELSANLWEDSNAWYTAVRVVEKTFDDETFKITEREIKITELSSKNYRYVGVREVIH